jgi:hypothetical protein
MAVSRSLRFQVLRRDGYRCHYCGATARDAKLTVDHVTATALGGTDTADNLVTACDTCNGGKSATPADASLVAQVQERDTQFQIAVAEVGEGDRERREFLDAFYIAWDLGVLPPGWAKTIDAYRPQGLAPHMWDEIIGIARVKTDLDDPFRYCCGIARNRVRLIQEQAAAQAGPSTGAGDDEVNPRVAALVEVWVNESGKITDDKGRAFEASVVRALEAECEDFHRWAEAAQYSAWFGLTDISEGLARMIRDHLLSSWTLSWFNTAGEYPSDSIEDRVSKQIDTLLTEGQYNEPRVEFAAVYAGAHLSDYLHFSLGVQELEATGIDSGFASVLEAWKTTFRSATGRWPIKGDGTGLLGKLRGIPSVPVTYDDVRRAAAMAAMYESTDLRPCLAPFGDIFAAAALLPDPAAANTA